ncbi:MAG: hypothetical protein Q9166_000922 [cf. Caloplaca sp. 2 TL-2023]
MSRPSPHPPVITSASQSAALAYVPPFGPQSEDFLLGPQPPIQQQEESQAQKAQQEQQPSPPNPRKRKAPELAPMAEVPLGLVPGYEPSSGYAAQSQQSEQQPDVSTQGTVPKKSRTNTPWTPAEEQRLKTMRDAGNSWNEIAKTFPNRTEGSVKKHWYKVGEYHPCIRPKLMQHQDMHYADFAEDESAALLAAIKEYEASKWKVIGAKVGKPAKACEQYAKEHFGARV